MDGTGDYKTKRTQRRLRAVSFSGDGQIIATAGRDRSIKLWRRDGKPLKTLFGHDGAVWQVRFDPQQKFLISSSEDRTVIIWDFGED